jgi:hypothetical protein
MKIDPDIDRTQITRDPIGRREDRGGVGDVSSHGGISTEFEHFLRDFQQGFPVAAISPTR